VSDYWARQAFRFAKNYPNAWARQIGRKFALFWNHFEIPNHYDMNFVKRFAPVLRNPIGTFAVLAPLGILGLVLAAVRRKRTGLLVAFAVTFMVSVMPFFVTARYRLAIVPVLLVGAGFAVTEIVSMFRKRSWKPLVAAGILLFLLTAGVNVDILEFGSAQMHNTLGAILGSQGDFEAAAAEFELALDENPRDLSARYNAGLALIELGRLDEAAVHLRRAVDAHPRYFEAWNALARARAGLGECEGALEALGSVLEADPPAPEPLVAEARSIAEPLLRATTLE
jgi:tetratricopeptide (TPR) repeat protein